MGVRMSEEWGMTKLQKIHDNEHKTLSTEAFVAMMIEVTVNETRALDKLRNLKALGKIVIHNEKVMLKWYYDLFYS